MSPDLIIHNRNHFSARRVREITGYTTDYIGQLCRAKKLSGEQVGRTWYVDEESLRVYLQMVETKKTGDKIEKAKEYLNGRATTSATDVELIPVVKQSQNSPVTNVDVIETNVAPSLSEVATTVTASERHVEEVAATVEINSGVVPEVSANFNAAATDAHVANSTEKFFTYARDIAPLFPVLSKKSFLKVTDDVIKPVVTPEINTTSDRSIKRTASPFRDFVFFKDSLSLVNSLTSKATALVIAFVLVFGSAFAIDAETLQFAGSGASHISLRAAENSSKLIASTVGTFLNKDESQISKTSRVLASAYEPAYPIVVSAVATTKNRVANYSSRFAKFVASLFETKNAPQLAVNATTTVTTSKVSSTTKIVSNATATVATSSNKKDLKKTPVVVLATTSPKVIATSANNTNEVRIVERYFTSSGVTEDEFNTRLEQLSNKLGSQIAGLTAQTTGQYTAAPSFYTVASQANRIDRLDGVSISNPSISGGSISNASVSGNISGTFIGTISSSTFAAGTTTSLGGFDISGGCFSVSGVCISNGGTLSGSGATGLAAFWTNAGNLSSNANFVWDNANSRLGIGTSTPYAPLSVNGEIAGGFFTGSSTATSTFAGGLRVDLLSVGSTTASSTFANGINLASGCFSINGTCITASGGSGTPGGGDTQVQFNDSNTFGGSPNFVFSKSGGLLTVSSLLTTFATTTNFLVTSSSTLQNVTFVNATGSNATTTNSFATTASSTNLFASMLSTGNFTASGLATISSLLLNGSTTLQNFTAINSTSSNATTTNSFATTASSTNLFATLLNVGNITGSGLATLSNILALGSTTLQNFTAVNSTSSNATTTALFATTASSTNLFATSAQLGNSVFGNTTSTNATTTGALSVGGALTVTGSATSSFSGGVLVNAGGLTLTTANCTLFGNGGKLTTDSSGNVVCANDSTGSGGSGTDVNFTFFNGSGIYVSTTTNQVVLGASATSSLAKLEVIGNTYINGNLGVGTTSPYAKLSVVGEAVASYFTATSTTFVSSFQQLLVNSSTSLQNFTAINATTSQATTTKLAITGITNCNTTSALTTNSNGSVVCGAISGTGSTGGGVGWASTTAPYLGNESIYSTGLGFIGVGTTTPRFALQIATSTRGQLALTDPTAPVDGKHWVFRSAGGSFYLNTAVDALNATSSSPMLELNSNLSSVGLGFTNSANYFGSVALGISNNSAYNQSVAVGYGNTAGHAGGNPFAVAVGASNSSVGDRSSAVGYGNTVTTALAYYSSAFGYQNSVGDQKANAFGSDNTASGNSSLAFGATNSATQLAASAFGYNNRATAQGASAFGVNNITSAQDASSFGYLNLASGLRASAYGASSTASAAFAAAFGYNNMASAQGATALGNNITNSTASSTMIGADDSSKLTILNSGRSGFGTTTPAWLLQLASSTKPQFALSDPAAGTGLKHWSFRSVGGSLFISTTSDTTFATSTKSMLVLDGENRTTGLGFNNTVWGSGGLSSLVIGDDNSALYHTTVAVGFRNSAGGAGGNPYSIAVGISNAVSGDTASAFGYTNTASGRFATALGYVNTSGIDTNNGLYAAAIGSNNTALQNNSSAIGASNRSTNISSSAFGYLNLATGEQSSAFGASSTASALLSSAFGYNNIASAQGATALGNNITNSTASSTMIGADNSSKLTILNSGRSGFGTTTPAWLLQLASSTASQLALSDGIATDNHWTFRNAGGSLYVASATASTYATSTQSVLSILTNGEINFGSNTITAHITPSAVVGYGNNVGMGAAGTPSSVFGIGNSVTGGNDLAIGNSNTISYHNSIAVGNSNSTGATDSSVAVGISNSALGDSAILFGVSNSGWNLGPAFGYGNSTGGGGSAFGYTNIAGTQFASAFGYKNLASGIQSSAFGASSTASALLSSAFGYNNIASAQGATAIGNNITNSTASSTVIGADNSSKLTILNSGRSGFGTTTPNWLLQLASSTAPQFALSDGIATDNHWTFRNAGGNLYVGTASPSTFATSTTPLIEIIANGGSHQGSLTLGYNTNGFTFGPNSGTGAVGIAVGYGNSIDPGGSSYNAVALGVLNLVSSAYNSSAVGYGNNTAATAESSAYGFSNTVSGDQSSAFGHANSVSSAGGLNTAIGWGNTIAANNSSAVGKSNSVSADNGLAFGLSNTVSATGASAFGSSITNNIASSVMLGPSDTSKLTIINSGRSGFGTTTPQWLLQLASSTVPQLALSDGTLTSNHWTFRNTGGNFYIATASPSTFATSSVTALSIDTNGLVTTGSLAVTGSSTLSNASVSGTLYMGSGSIYSTISNVNTNGLVMGYTNTVVANSSNEANYVLGTQNNYVPSVSGTSNFIAGSLNTLGGTLTNSNTIIGSQNSISTAGVTLGDVIIGGSNTVSLSSKNYSYLIGMGNTSQATGAFVFGAGITNNIASSTMIGPSDAAKYTMLISGRTGLGTTTPAWLLHLASSTAPQLALTDPNGGTNAKHGFFRFANGELYVGTSSDALNATTTYLTLTGSSTTFASALNVTSNATSSFSNGLAISGGCFSVNGTCLQPNGTTGSGATGQVTFWTGSNSISGNNNFFYDNNKGALGIGTTTPYVNLQIASSTAAQFALTDPSGPTNGKHFFFRSAGGNLYIGSTSDSLSATSTYLTLNTLGYLGVGTTSPFAQLSVKGSDAVTGSAPLAFALYGGAGAATNGVGGGSLIQLGTGAGSGAGGAFNLTAGTGGNSGAGGAINVTGGSGGASSGNGGAISLTSGAPGGNSNSGAITIATAGTSGSGSIGALNITGGTNSTGSANGGTITLTSGASTGAGGSATLSLVGGTSAGTGGTITLTPGAGDASNGGAGGSLTINSGQGGLNSSAGSLTIAGGAGNGTGSGGQVNITGGNAGTTNVNGANVVINGGAQGGTAKPGNVLLATARGNVGIGTTTPNWILQIASSTKAQLALTDPNGGTNAKHGFFRFANGNMYIGTSSDALDATTTLLTINDGGQLLTGNGALTQPTYSFTSDTDTGIYKNASSDYLTITRNGIGALSINASGQFGIGAAAAGGSVQTNSQFYVSTSTNIGATATSRIALRGNLDMFASNSSASGSALSVVAQSSTGLHAGTLYGVNASSFDASTTIGGIFSVGSSVGSVTNAYGLQVAVTNGGLSLTNGYGLYLGDIEGTNQYGIYQSGATDTNYFAGYSGFGTTTPKWVLEIASSTAPQFALSDGTLTSNHWTFRNTGGNFYIATASPSTFATSTDSALSITSSGIVSIGEGSQFTSDIYTGSTTIANLITGNMKFDADAGVVQWTDLPFSSAAAGTQEAYTAFMGGNPMITVAGQSNGTSIYGIGVGIGTTSPYAALTIWGKGSNDSTASTTLEVVNAASTTLFKIADTGTGYFANTFGIGTTTPNWALQIASSTRPQLALSSGSLTDSHWTFRNAGGSLFIATASPSTFATSTFTALSVNSSGYVGVGTTSPTQPLSVSGNAYVGGALGVGTNNPGYTLDVNGSFMSRSTAQMVFSRGNNGNTVSSEFIVPNPAEIVIKDNDDSGCSQLNMSFTDALNATLGLIGPSTDASCSSSFYVQTTNSLILNGGVVSLQAGSAEKARVATNGLGVGTTTPSWALQVASSTRAQFALSDGSLTSNHWTFRSAGNSLYIATASPSTFATSTFTALTINGNGFVGIGSTSPTSLFSVHGSSFLGSGSGSTLTINSNTIALPIASTTTIPNNTNFAFSIATSTTANKPLFTIDTTSGRRATTTINDSLSLNGGALEYDASTGITTVDAINTGPMAFDTDAGILSWVDMPISTTTANINMSYSAQMGTNPVLTIFGTTTSSGAITHGTVGIGTTTPQWSLTATGGFCLNDSTSSCATTETSGAIYAGSGTAKHYLAGYLGVGTTTSQWALQIASSSKQQLALSDASLTSNHWTFRNAGGNLYIATASPSTFATSTFTALSVNTNGFVGVGTTSPSTNLSVTGSAYVTTGLGINTLLGSEALSVIMPGASRVSPLNGGYIALFEHAVGGGSTAQIVVRENSSGSELEIGTANATGQNTYIGTGLSQVFQIKTNNTVRETFSAAGGQVGIGTTTPQWLQQLATSTAPQLALSDASLTSNHWTFRSAANALYIATASPSTFATSSVPALAISSNGLVGIGTTSPYANLAVTGFAAASYFNADATTSTSTLSGGLSVNSGLLSHNFSTGETSIASLISGTQSFDTDAGNVQWTDLPFGSAANGTLQSYTAYMGGNPMITVGGQSNGSSIYGLGVGIGTTSPYAALTIWGKGSTTANASTTIEAVNSASTTIFKLMDNGTLGLGTSTPNWKLQIASSSQPQLSLSDASLTSNHWTFRSAGNFLYVATGSASTYATSTFTALTINNNGFTGVGTSSPWRNLSVTGTVAINGLTAESGTQDALCIDSTTKEVQVNSGAATCTVSSARFKHSVETLSATSGISLVRQLRPVSFLTNDTNESRVGFIAEEVNQLDPRLVFYENDGVTPRGVNYEEFAPILTKAVQDIDTRLLALESAASTTASVSGAFSVDALTNSLKQFGIFVTDSLVHITHLAVDSLKVGSSDNPVGITLFDQTSKAPYCLTIDNGVTKTTSGECVDAKAVTTYVSGGSSVPPMTETASSTPTVSGDSTTVSIPVVDTASSTNDVIPTATTTGQTAASQL